MNEVDRKLIVDAGHPAVRIEVLDSSFLIKAKGYGRIEENLPTGFYTVRYLAGDAHEDQEIALRPDDDPFILNMPPKNLEFASAAPIENTWTSQNSHGQHAKRLSKVHPLGRGKGAEVFIFIRDLAPGGPRPLTKGLSLHRLDGEPVCNLEQIVENSKGADEALWAGQNISLDPGIYRLRLVLDRSRTIEMAVVACPGWQSQVFLLRQGYPMKKSGWPNIDFSEAAQLIVPPKQGFEPKSQQQDSFDILITGDDLRLSELARFALAQGRQGIRTRDLKMMLNGKWRDPILGILGVHLLLMRPTPDLALAERVIQRLREEILQGFRLPDVEILALEIARQQGVSIEIPPIVAPPLLRQSWQMLVSATAANPSLVPAGSLTSLIADHLWGTGAWLIWEVPKEAKIASGEKGDWLSRFAESERTSKEGTIRILDDRVIIGGVSIPRAGAHLDGLVAPDTGEISKVVLENFSINSDNIASLNISSSNSKIITDALAKNIHSFRGQFADVDYPIVRNAIEKLGPDITRFMSNRTLDDLARMTKLDNVEFALLVVISAQLSEQRKPQSEIIQDALSLPALVEQLSLPAERIRSAMTTLLVKLLWEFQK